MKSDWHLLAAIVAFLVVFTVVAYVVINVAVGGVIWWQQNLVPSLPTWLKWILAASGLAVLLVVLRVPGRPCDPPPSRQSLGCGRWVWFFAPGWHTERDISTARTYTYCPACWAAAAPVRAKKAASALARAADLRVRSKQYPRPPAAEVQTARVLVEQLRSPTAGQGTIDTVERLLHKYGPNLPQDLLTDIETLTARGFTGSKGVGYMQDDESGYKWVSTGESVPCYIDTSRTARQAREFLEMDAARRAGDSAR